LLFRSEFESAVEGYGGSVKDEVKRLEKELVEKQKKMEAIEDTNLMLER